jgi:hypothetical protein
MADDNQSGGLAVTLPFAGEDRLFKLGIGQWRAIQDKCKAGPEIIAARLATSSSAIGLGLDLVNSIAAGAVGDWRVDDVREVIFQGLIGGGTDVTTSTLLVQTYVDVRNTRPLVPVAFGIVKASLEGLATSAPGEAKGADPDPDPGPLKTDASATATSTGAEVGAASPPSMLTG